MNELQLAFFCNNHPDDYVFAHSHKQKNNLLHTAENRVVYVTVFIDCGETGVRRCWRSVASGLLARAAKQGVRTRTKADVAQPPRAWGLGPDRPISRTDKGPTIW